MPEYAYSKLQSTSANTFVSETLQQQDVGFFLSMFHTSKKMIQRFLDDHK